MLRRGMNDRLITVLSVIPVYIGEIGTFRTGKCENNGDILENNDRNRAILRLDLSISPKHAGITGINTDERELQS